jgi:hypothetical protein
MQHFTPTVKARATMTAEDPSVERKTKLIGVWATVIEFVNCKAKQQ